MRIDRMSVESVDGRVDRVCRRGVSQGNAVREF